MQLVSCYSNEHEIQDDDYREEAHRVVVECLKSKERELKQAIVIDGKRTYGYELTHNQTNDPDDNDSDVI